MGPDAHAPWGYVIDTATGARRPRKSPGGRRRKTTEVPSPSEAGDGGQSARPAGTPPSLQQLKAAGPRSRPADRAPGATRPKTRADKRRRTGRRERSRPEPDLPPFRAGPIATGMNRLYARAGKILRVWDKAIGTAVISITRKDAPEDVTVGEAWEELAKNNPRVRAFLLRLITGGSYTQLLMCHAPIVLAVLLKESIASRLPLTRLITSFIDPDDDEDQDERDLDEQLDQEADFVHAGFPQGFGGLRPEDLGAMMDMVSNQMGGLFAGAMPPEGRNPHAGVRVPVLEQLDEGGDPGQVGG